MLRSSLQQDYAERFVVKREYVWALKFDPTQPRDKAGRFAKGASTVETCEAGEPGLCFANVNRWNARHGSQTDKIVHGKVTNAEGKTFDHAWIERANGTVVDPTTGVILAKEKYYALLNAQLEASYTSTEAIRNQIRARHHGPWTRQDLGLKWDPSQPRDKQGRWARVMGRMAHMKAIYSAVAHNYPRDTGTEMGSIEAHTGDVGREWEKQLTDEELAGISERFGSDVGRLMESAIPLHDIGKAEAIEEGGGKEQQHEYTTPILQDVLRKEGFSEKDITLATELMNHDLIGPLFRGYEGFKAKEAEVVAKLQEKAKKVGMNIADFVTLQLAFYQADASAYPYITQYMDQEPSGKWTFRGNKKIAAIEALVRKREYVREPSGTSEGGRFAKVGGFQASNKNTWLKHEGGWNRSSTGEQPYGWEDLPESSDYEPPAITHQILRMKNIGLWGGSHSGSSAITGAAAREMGIEGYRDLGWKESDPIAQRMLEEIYNDATGSEEPLYHAFQNVSFTDFQPGDTMDLPLLASAGKPETGYATRGAHEHQEGPPTVFVFPKGTRMVAYGKWPTDPKQRGYEDGNAKEFGHVYSEAIVAGRFRVVKTEVKYFGSMHSDKRVAEGTPIPQLYGQVVHLEPIGYFNPTTGKWEDHG